MMSLTGDWSQTYFSILIHIILLLYLFLYFDTRIIEAYTDTAWGGGFNDVRAR